MASRDLTKLFIQQRNFHLPTKKRKTYEELEEEDDEVELEYTTNQKKKLDEESAANHFSDPSIAPPQWVLILNTVREDMTDIKQRMMNLNEMHMAHLKPGFGKDFAKEERDIEIQTAEIKRLFKECKEDIERIQLSQQTQSQAEMMKKNSKIALVNEINELVTKFRLSQKEYLTNMRSFKERRKDLAPIQDSGDLDAEDNARIEEIKQKLHSGWSEKQIEDLVHNEMDIIRRDKEIREILSSIVDLQDLFKEFSVLVIEQGSMLDRIDYHIDMASTHVEKGNKELVKAEKYQKWNRLSLCVLLLLVILLGVVTIILLKVGLQAVPYIVKFGKLLLIPLLI